MICSMSHCILIHLNNEDIHIIIILFTWELKFQKVIKYPPHIILAIINIEILIT